MASSLSAPLSKGQSMGVRVSFGAIVGGTVEEIGGGKFANGAVTGSFTVLYNEMMHQFDNPDKYNTKYFGRFFDSRDEARGVAQELVQKLKIEIKVVTMCDPNGTEKYFLAPYYNNTETTAEWTNVESYAKLGGYSVESEEHFSLRGPTDASKGNSYMVSQRDYESCIAWQVPITHTTIGYGSWTIDPHGSIIHFSPVVGFKTFGNAKYFDLTPYDLK